VRASIADPEWCEAKVHEVCKDAKQVKSVKVIKGQELFDLGMNLIWNVGRGAVKEPRAVFVHYAGNENSDEVELAIVGKGVTYDTGGLNIKLRMMEMMHGDKGGAAAVLGALEGSIALNLKKNVVFVFGFAENAIGPECYKPGDILKAMNGLAVEVGNTDAEGRLVMSDCMTYVQRTYKPK
jgi:leucyl aminopeptidase